MLTIDFYLGKGNRLPSLFQTLQDAAGVALDLTNATVTLTMRDFATATVKINAVSVTIINPLLGTVRYDWTTGDAALAAGYYYGRFTVTYSDTRVLSVPNNDWLILKISEAT